ncbi:MAG: hypothetical protein GY768_12595 [Planctomycetaceae bacterium]|nr:hypothetical protein [Planctomycetaceae bacterium]
MITSRKSTGLSLIEVVLAMAILAGAMVALSQLIGLGLRSAAEARDLARAQILAESVMAEITIGTIPATSINQMAIDSEPGWLVSITAGTTLQDGVIQVIVVTERQTDRTNAARFELSRWMRDPSLPLPTDEELEDDTTSSNSSSSSSSSSGSGSQAGGGL